MINNEIQLKYFLRITGLVSMIAVIFIAAPFSWMVKIHEQLGLGLLPEIPITGYLTRSLSAFYVFLGGLFWALSFDIKKFKPIISFIGIAIIIFGIAMFAVDFSVGLPLFWKIGEGMANVIIGVVILFLNRKINFNNN